MCQFEEKLLFIDKVPFNLISQKDEKLNELFYFDDKKERLKEFSNKSSSISKRIKKNK